MRLLLVAALLSFVTALEAFAQEAPPKIEVGGIRTIGELLRQHNVELTEPALLQALKSPDADVRYLSAMKLAEDKVINAVPAIKEALAAETVPRDRVNLALTLGLLGHPSGPDELKRMCADENFPPEFRLYAVRYMFDLGTENDDGCLHAAEDAAKMVDSGNRVTAFELLVRFRTLTSEESQSVFDLVLHGLNDPDPFVRMGASSAFATLGDRNAIPYLKVAIAQEEDENLRSVLKINLKKLQQKPKQ
ncbi:MAG TPA: HEAT repeat domain-containing protein [Terriglobales bacterium]|nr:HEAT repeat domain-containing protein [Terriglobales bacterium]